MSREWLCGEGRGNYTQFGDHTVTVSNWFYPATCHFFPGENRACSNVKCVKRTWGIKGMMEFTVASEGCSPPCKTVLHWGKNLFITRVSHECASSSGWKYSAFSVCACYLFVLLTFICPGVYKLKMYCKGSQTHWAHLVHGRLLYSSAIQSRSHIHSVKNILTTSPNCSFGIGLRRKQICCYTSVAESTGLHFHTFLVH